MSDFQIFSVSDFQLFSVWGSSWRAGVKREFFAGMMMTHRPNRHKTKSPDPRILLAKARLGPLSMQL